MKIKSLLFITFLLSLFLFSCESTNDTNNTFPEELNTLKATITENFDGLNQKLNLTSTQIISNEPDSANICAALNAYMESPGIIFDIAYINKDGIIEYVAPVEYSDVLVGNEVSSQLDFSYIKDNLLPSLSESFISWEGFFGATLGYPVLIDNEFIGYLSALFKPDKYLEEIIVPVTANKDFHIWVMEINGTILYDEESAMIGVNVLENPIFQSMQSLVDAAEKIISEDTGNTIYEYVNPYTQEFLKMKAYWVTYTMGSNSWKLIYTKKV